MSQMTEKAQNEISSLADRNVDSTDSDLRYMAYAARLRTAVRAGSRYIAYTSDVGEAFRPVVPPAVVTACYGISWLYLAGCVPFHQYLCRIVTSHTSDVSYEAYKTHRRGPSPIEAAHFSEPTRVGMVAVKRAVFQSVASMALPAFTIHTAVNQAKKAFTNVQNKRLKTWGPTISGLAIVPFLPYIFDHPVETATDKAFEWIEKRLIESQDIREKS
ncbi:mitochondrial 18 KDa protein-domain-containing protein [Suillus bovinus]|uniref:mitochondrial 18 KDa protein-domain-containing protein n=1 Tax=Suillus bovinus TaxID=48563 RepID=UPI001B876BE1|nr:mitochondrial 18 KDa protein-domain-containing protein [Suillus bovinus]KAG2158948.1 mitochondrial 18 KDa protein-domain-containing protein [Suillus bovinus]